MLMRQNPSVEAMELHTITYDVHALRNSLVGKGGAVELELLFHPWLFPTLEYRQEAALDAYVCLFSPEGLLSCAEPTDAVPVGKYARAEQRVAVRDKVFMAMEPARTRFRVDPYRPVVRFWSICVAAGRDIALVTQHVLLCETATGILSRVGSAFGVLAPGTTSAVLQHLEAVLIATEDCAKRLSKLMARAEAAFDGVPLDLDGKRYDGPTEPHEVWEDQLRLLCRMQDPSAHPAPLLNEMIHVKVLQQIGKDLPGEGDARARGEAAWKGASVKTKARVIHRVVTEFIAMFEGLAESQAEILAANPF